MSVRIGYALRCRRNRVGSMGGWVCRSDGMRGPRWAANRLACNRSPQLSLCGRRRKLERVLAAKGEKSQHPSKQKRHSSRLRNARHRSECVGGAKQFAVCVTCGKRIISDCTGSEEEVAICRHEQYGVVAVAIAIIGDASLRKRRQDPRIVSGRCWCGERTFIARAIRAAGFRPLQGRASGQKKQVGGELT